MIRPLRRAHRWILPVLLGVLAVTALLVLLNPASSALIEEIPPAISERPLRQ